MLEVERDDAKNNIAMDDQACKRIIGLVRGATGKDPLKLTLFRSCSRSKFQAIPYKTVHLSGSYLLLLLLKLSFSLFFTHFLFPDIQAIVSSMQYIIKFAFLVATVFGATALAAPCADVSNVVEARGCILKLVLNKGNLMGVLKASDDLSGSLLDELDAALPEDFAVLSDDGKFIPGKDDDGVLKVLKGKL